MKKSTASRALSILLALIMAFTALPLFEVSAAGIISISSLSVTVNEPVAATAPSYEATVPYGAHYTAEITSWWQDVDGDDDYETRLENDTKFEIGGKYQVLVNLTPDDGYEIATYFIARINGKGKGDPSVPVMSINKLNGKLNIWANFVAVPRGISSAFATVTAPLEGENPYYGAVVPSDHLYESYKVQVQGWWQDENDNFCTTVADDMVFEADREYQVCLMFTPKNGRYLQMNTTVNVEGKYGESAKSIVNINQYDDGRLLVYVNFIAGRAVKTVSLTTTAPVEGAEPFYTVDTTDTEYTTSFGNWYNQDYYGDFCCHMGDIYDEEADSHFIAGDLYEITFILRPNDGFNFTAITKVSVNNWTPANNEDPLDARSIVSVNANKYKSGNPPKGELYVRVVFKAKPSLLSEVRAGLTAMQRPVHGEHPVTGKMFVGEGAGWLRAYYDYTAQLVEWYKKDENGSFILMDKKKDAFLAGNTYQAKVRFMPKDGFRMTLEDTTPIVRNGKNNLEIVNKIMNQDGSLEVWANILVERKKIDEIKAVVPFPLAGQAPGSAEIFDSPYYSDRLSLEVAETSWYKGADWNSATKLGAGQTFAADQKYWAKIKFAVSEPGRRFFDTSAPPEITVYRPQPGVDVQRIALTDIECTVVVPFTARRELQSISLTMTIPLLYRTPSNTPMPVVPPGEHFTIDAEDYTDLTWRHSDGSLMRDTEQFLDMNEVYELEIFCNAAAGYAPGANTTVVINGGEGNLRAEIHQDDEEYCCDEFELYVFCSCNERLQPEATVTISDMLTPNDVTVELPDDEGYTAEIIDWYWGDSLAAREKMTPEERSKRFDPKNTYWPEVKFSAGERGVFTDYDGVALTYINLKDATIISKSSKEVVATAGLKPLITIHSVDLQRQNKNFAFPEVGKAPWFGPEIVNTKSYSATLQGWYVGELLNSAVKVSEGGVFEKDRTYWAKVILTPKSGYIFSPDIFTENKVTFWAAGYHYGKQFTEGVPAGSLGAYCKIGMTFIPEIVMNVYENDYEAGEDEKIRSVMGLRDKQTNGWLGKLVLPKQAGYYVIDGPMVALELDDPPMKPGKEYTVKTRFRAGDGYAITPETKVGLGVCCSDSDLVKKEFIGSNDWDSDMLVGSPPALDVYYRIKMKGIDKVTMWINEPVVGQCPSLDINTPDTSDTAGGRDTYRAEITSWQRYKSQTSEWVTMDTMDENETFKAGVKYRVNIGCYVNDYGYMFLEKEDRVNNTAIELDGKALDKADGHINMASTVLSFSREFEAAREPISQVELTVCEPAIGDEPDRHVVLPDGAHYTAEILNWWVHKEKKDDCGETYMIRSDYTIAFKHGYYYKPFVTIMPADGYGLTEETQVLINGRPASCYLRTGYLYGGAFLDDLAHTFNYTLVDPPTKTTEGRLSASCPSCGVTSSPILPVLNTEDYTCEITPATTEAPGCERYTLKNKEYGDWTFEVEIPQIPVIREIVINGVTAPAIGQTPDAAHFSVPAGAHYHVAAIDWHKEGEVSAYTAPFEADAAYWVLANVIPDDSAVFADGLTVKINGLEGYVKSGGAGNTYANVACTFPKIEPIKLEAIEITNITPPAVGQTPDEAHFSVPAGAHYQVTKIQWFDSKLYQYKEPFAADAVYLVIANVIPDKGYAFSDGLTVKINGFEGEVRSGGAGCDYANVAYTFPPTGSAAPAVYTVSFNANGGTGAPASQTKTQGEALTLSTAVPAREGHIFLGWAAAPDAAAAQYQPGGSFTADADTVLYAVWQPSAGGLLGDVNLDGIVDAGDAVLVLRHDAKLITLTGQGLANGDVNKDGLVDAGDAVLILRYDARLIDHF